MTDVVRRRWCIQISNLRNAINVHVLVFSVWRFLCQRLEHSFYRLQHPGLISEIFRLDSLQNGKQSNVQFSIINNVTYIVHQQKPKASFAYASQLLGVGEFLYTMNTCNSCLIPICIFSFKKKFLITGWKLMHILHLDNNCT